MTVYIRTGSKGGKVKSWQKASNKVRAKTGAKKLIPDGIYGPKTAKATILIQRYLGTKPDGLVGPKTVKKWNKRFPHVPLSFGISTTNADKVNKSGTGVKKKPRVKIAAAALETPKASGGIMLLVALAVGVGVFMKMRKKR